MTPARHLSQRSTVCRNARQPGHIFPRSDLVSPLQRTGDRSSAPACACERCRGDGDGSAAREVTAGLSIDRPIAIAPTSARMTG
jgi:hypothetical protein